MSGIDCNSDSDAAINLSRVLYFLARILAFLDDFIQLITASSEAPRIPDASSP